MRSILLLFSLLTSFYLTPQQLYERPLYDYIWLFNNSRMDFNYDPVLITADEQPMPFEGTNASICDEQGELLASTNGIYIADALGDTISNSFYFNPGPHAEQWVDNGFIFPQMALFLKSSVGENYFLLHENVERLTEANEYGDVFQTYNLSQSILSTNNDELVLTSKNDTILTGNLGIGQLTAVRSGDGSSWWMLINKNYTNQYIKLLLTGDTILQNGITTVGDTIRTGLGASKFSPDGLKYAKLDLVDFDNQTISIYDFDRCTGNLSSPVHIPYQDTSFTGGLAFSENSRFLYVPSFVYLYQYDLAAEDIVASKVILRHSFDGWGYFMAQLAPDGKIYISHQGTQDSIHVIHHPNRKGHACGFEHLGQPLPANTFRTMPNYPYYGLGPWDGSPCDTLNIDNPVPEAAFEYTHDTTGEVVTFFDASHYAYEWYWDFGDDSGETPYTIAQYPVHAYSEPGAYQVCLTVSNVTGIDTYCETIQVGPVSTQEIFAPGVAVKVWPNPVSKGPLYFQISGLDNKNTLYLYLRDSQGRLMLKDTFPVRGGTNQHQLNIDHLPPGLYFYELHGQRPLASGKVVIIP